MGRTACLRLRRCRSALPACNASEVTMPEMPDDFLEDRTIPRGKYVGRLVGRYGELRPLHEMRGLRRLDRLPGSWQRGVRP